MSACRSPRLPPASAKPTPTSSARACFAPIVGHVGDGNFHVMPQFTAGSAQERRAVQGFLDRLVDRALRMDGTCSGEHGVGQGKIRYLAQEHGAGVEVMI